MKAIAYIFLLTGALMVGCTSTYLPAVKTDFDHEVDFGAYSSFNWSDEMDQQEAAHPILDNSLVRKRIKSAIRSEMEGRGYTFQENADLLINFHLVIEEKTGYSTYPAYGYSYWRRDNVRPYNYKEGTLIIDIIDREQNQLVWQGYTEGVLSNDPEKMEDKMRQAISLIFQEYRYRAREAS